MVGRALRKGRDPVLLQRFLRNLRVRRRTVATYERRVESLDANRRGFIDLFWPGTLIVEQKSAGRDLFKASSQAMEYFDWLPANQQPRYILTCDFQRWHLVDLDTNRDWRFTLPELHKHVEDFAFILGRQRTFQTQATVTIKAAELMGRLHDALQDAGYTGHDLEQLLVRLLFCLFADDTGIFQPAQIFLQLLENDTQDDGRDTGRTLMELFDILDTPEDKRQAGLSAELNAFPYVNGALFAGRLRTPVFDARMRNFLIDACRHNWSAVSPAIFGSLFQSVMDAKQRRAKGAHYTSEANILKVIGPLFLDDLRAEFNRLKRFQTSMTGRARNAPLAANKARLQELQRRLRRMTFFDPACGCGNFLVIAYREVRRLELDILKELFTDEIVISGFDAAMMSQVDVDQFYGIEIEEFPARIAKSRCGWPITLPIATLTTLSAQRRPEFH